MSYFDYDPEVPAGFQEADFEMAALEEAAARSAALRRRGICDHGWCQGLGRDGQWHGEGEAPPPGHVYCFHCKQVVPDPHPDKPWD